MTSTKCRVFSVGSALDDLVLLVSCARLRHSSGYALAMHGVALPDNDVVCSLDSVDVCRQVLVHLVCAVTTDDDYLSGYTVGIDDCSLAPRSMGDWQLTIKQPDQLLCFHGWSDLDTAESSARTAVDNLSSSHRIGDSTEILHMRSIQLPGPVANPDEVTRDIIVLWLRYVLGQAAHRSLYAQTGNAL